MTARTMPTLPAFPANSGVTSGQMTQLLTWHQFWANPPMFRMYQSVSQSIPNAADTQITCDTPTYDSDSGRSGTTPWSYVIPVGMSGRWQFTGCALFAGNATGSRQSKLFKNGALIPDGSYVAAQAGPSTNNCGVVTTTTALCNAGDTISLYGYQSSGASLSTSVVVGLTSYFEGRLVSLGNP